MKNSILLPLLLALAMVVGCAESTEEATLENSESSELNEEQELSDDTIELVGSESTTGLKPEADTLEEEPCEGDECDLESMCNTDEDCSFLQEDIPECSVVQCSSDTKNCEVVDDPVPGCLSPQPPANTLCVIDGEAGEEARCGIRVARTNENVPGPTSLTVTLEYPANLLEGVSVLHYPCGNTSNCAGVELPENPLMSGGVVTIKPETTEEWDGLVQIKADAPEDAPDTLITEVTTGDLNLLFEVVFTLPYTIEIPIWVEINNPTAKGLPGSEITAEYGDDLILISGEPLVGPCDPASDPDCGTQDPDASCSLSGSAGEEVRCNVELVRASSTDGRPVTGSFSVSYDASRVKLVRFESQECVLDDCTPLNIPEVAMATGHGVTLAPATAEEWSGSGTIEFSAPVDNPNAVPLTEAALDENGSLDGPADFVSAVFVMLNDVVQEQAASVSIGQLEFNGAEGIALATTLDENTIIVSGAEQCPFAPGCGGIIDIPDVPLPENSLCRVFGEAGKVVDCPLAIAKSAENNLPATSLQFSLQYDANNVSFDGVFADICYEGGSDCYEQSVVDGGQNLPTGHSFVTAPLTVEQWGGEVTFILTNSSKPETPITEAFVDENGEIAGEPAFARARFVLLENVPENTPFFVMFIPENFVAGNIESLEDGGNEAELPVKLQEGLIITGQPGALEEVP